MSRQINLFNPLFADKPTYLSANSMLKGAGIVFMGCTLLGAYLYYEVHVLTKSAAEANAKLSVSAKELTQVKTQHAKKDKSHELEAQVQQTEQEIRTLRKVLEILSKGNIGNTDGYSAYMQALARQSLDGIWLTGFNIVGAGNKVELEGKAVKPDLVPLYVNRLKNEPILKGKSFGKLEIAAPSATPDAGAKTRGAEESHGSKALSYVEFRLN